MISIDLSDIVISNVNDANYRSIINGISKCHALNLLKNADLIKMEHYKDKKNSKKIITIFEMGKETITFGKIEVEKQKFHQHKSPISIYDVNIDRIVIPNKVLFDVKDKIQDKILNSQEFLNSSKNLNIGENSQFTKSFSTYRKYVTRYILIRYKKC